MAYMAYLYPNDGRFQHFQNDALWPNINKRGWVV